MLVKWCIITVIEMVQEIRCRKFRRIENGKFIFEEYYKAIS